MDDRRVADADRCGTETATFQRTYADPTVDMGGPFYFVTERVFSTLVKVPAYCGARAPRVPAADGWPSRRPRYSKIVLSGHADFEAALRRELIIDRPMASGYATRFLVG